MISKNRIKRYLKKYRWVLIALLFVGIGLLAWGVKSNKEMINLEEKKVKVEKVILFAAPDNNSTNLIGDFNALISTNSFKKKVCDNSQDVEISAARIADSNCIAIDVIANDKEKAKKVCAKVVDEGKKTFSQYYPQVQLEEIDETYKTEDESSKAIVQLKDLLLLLAPFVVGLFIIYFLMVLDDRIYDAFELEKFCNILVFECSKEQCERELARTDNHITIYGKNCEDVKDESADGVTLNTFIKTKIGIGTPKVLILKKGNVLSKELATFLEIVDKDSEKKVKIFLIDEQV